MAHSAPTQPSPGAWHPDSLEARRLADALRRGRLSVLSGAQGAGKTSLILGGLMPLLRRRVRDAAIADAQRESAVIMPFPERRSAARAQRAELVVFFDRWDDAAPLAELNKAIDAALRACGVEPAAQAPRLADRIKDLADRYGTRVLFVLDAFDVFLEHWNRDAPNAFVDELVEMVNKRLPAHVLIALRSQAEPLLQTFGEGLVIDDVEVLVLPHWRHDDAAVMAPVSEPTPQPAPVVTVPLSPPRLRVVPRSTAAISTAPVPASEPAPLAEEPPHPALPTRVAHAPPPRHPSKRLWPIVAAIVVLLLAAALWWSAMNKSSPAAVPLTTTESSAAPAPLSSPSPEPAVPTPIQPLLPRIDVHVDAEGGAVPRLPAELARALAADGRVDLRVNTEGEGAAAGARSSHLSIVRYDALVSIAGQTTRPNRIAVIAPLYTEELFVVVRADSPLTSIDQLEGRRINVGPEFGDRSHTAATVYQRLFGKPLAPTPEAHLGAAAALDKLAHGHSLDAVLLVEPQPAATLAALTAATRQALKLLPLDAARPASRRLLQAYLPATLRTAGDMARQAAVPTVSAMTFLVSDGPRDASESETLVRLVDSLCHVLPQLRRDGDPKWRELRPGQQLETGWPALPATAAAWSRCANTTAPSAVPVNPPVPSPKGERP